MVILRLTGEKHSPTNTSYNGVFTPEQDNDKTTRHMLKPVHFYDAFHTRSDNGKTGVHSVTRSSPDQGNGTALYLIIMVI